MKLTAQIQLRPSSEQKQALLETILACNNASQEVSEHAWANKLFNTYKLRKSIYYKIKQDYHLGAQITGNLIRKVAKSYKTVRTKSCKFKEFGGVIFDSNILTIKQSKQLISIWTTSGRLKIMYSLGKHQTELLKNKIGESILIYRDNKFYLHISCDVTPIQMAPFDNVLGVDMGVKNIATLSDGQNYAANQLLKVRHRNTKLRQKLQKIGTKSAKRLLKKRSRKEARFAKDVNHTISKNIVQKAKGTNSAVAIEDLSYIRQRVTVKKGHRMSLHSWAFSQLRQCIEYKATLNGVKVYLIDPRYTSQKCSVCGYTNKSNRISRDKFHCRKCGYINCADVNGAINIASIARLNVNKPNVG